ncbi:MAG TPA: helix-turn-helix transcriptional regulator, partial [Actinomycetales bacterium]|nr:helix-turn-helix transcriptional regulator [Actinomycetales bacterium]
MTTLPAAHRGPLDGALPAPEPGSRRAEIALAAAEEFTLRGYHSTRVEHIAERLAVTSGALYRHVQGKYEMFRDAVFTLVVELDAAAGTGDLEALVAAVTRATLVHRSRGALYRWHGRYLSPEDRAAVTAVFEQIRSRITDAVRAHRAGLDVNPRGSGSAAGAILAAVASLGDHRVAV